MRSCSRVSSKTWAPADFRLKLAVDSMIDVRNDVHNTYCTAVGTPLCVRLIVQQEGRHTFLAYGDLLISRRALAPRSRASGSKPTPLGSSQYATVPPAAMAAATAAPARHLPASVRNAILAGRVLCDLRKLSALTVGKCQS